MTKYIISVRALKGASFSHWREYVAKFTQKPYNNNWGWMDSPSDTILYCRYDVGEENPMIATIIGNSLIPPGKVSSWGVKLMVSKDNNEYEILVGVALADIDQNVDDNRNKCGWYLHCWSSGLLSGPPHKYNDKEYGPRKGNGNYVHTGDSVGVVIDVSKGELSFVVNGVNLGVAYDKIPKDKLLVPCMLLWNSGDSVKLVTEEDMMSDDSKKDKDCVIS